MGIAGQAGARWAAKVILGAALVLAACGPPPGVTGPGAAPTAPAAEARPLVIFVRAEPVYMVTRPLVQASASVRTVSRIFNAMPAVIDARGVPLPELLQSLPMLNTDSWRVFPDGTMQTTYALRPNLTWHDGVLLTSEDFVFSWRVYSSPALGLASQQPMSSIADIAAPDAQHFVIRWKVPYPDADSLSPYSRELPPLPEHILGSAFDQLATTGRDAFASQPFFTLQHVGLGPYRLQRWEPGSFIDAVRFDGFALGAAKIARIQLRFSADPNVVIASLLAGEAHVASDNAIAELPEALIQQWVPAQRGSIIRSAGSWRSMVFQLRPELANPAAILDLRVRKAITYAVDKQAINDAVYGGQAFVAETPIWNGSAWGDAIDNSISTYPLDLRATDSLLTQAAFSKGSDGFYRGPDGRLSLELATTESADSVREILVMADSFGVAGLDIQQRVIPVALAQDAQVRASFPALQNVGVGLGEVALQTLASSQIPTPANRWLGFNRGGWSSPEYDRLLNVFNTTLDRSERVTILRQMLRLSNEELPSRALFFPGTAFAYAAELKGPATAASESTTAWNISQWEFK